MDIVVSQLLFVGRHSLASRGASEAVVGSIPLIYGAGYFLAGPLMRAVIRPHLAKLQMLAAIGLISGLSLLLAQSSTLRTNQILFFFLPFGVSFFFNAFQAFMLGDSNRSARPLHITVALYTFAWSLGFAIGPFVSGITTDLFSWSSNYYLAAVFSLLIALLIAGFRPERRNRVEPDHGKPSRREGPPFHIPGWMGVVIGLIAWLTIATYWPVIAAQNRISPVTRGLVEFAFALSQGFGAFAMILLGRWQHRIIALPAFGMFGVTALLLFGNSTGPALYLIGASVMGLFTAGTFLFSVYHCMYDSRKAAKRVAVNEMMVGLGFLIGPGIAALLHSEDKPFTQAFTLAATLIAGLVGLQTWIAVRFQQRFQSGAEKSSAER